MCDFVEKAITRFHDVTKKVITNKVQGCLISFFEHEERNPTKFILTEEVDKILGSKKKVSYCLCENSFYEEVFIGKVRDHYHKTRQDRGADKITL